jgi:hypothetical protein
MAVGFYQMVMKCFIVASVLFVESSLASSNAVNDSPLKSERLITDSSFAIWFLQVIFE